MGLDVGPNRWSMQGKWHERTEWNTVSHQIEKKTLLFVLYGTNKQIEASKAITHIKTAAIVYI